MPDAVFKAADRLAKRLGISRSALYTRAVAEFVSRHKNDHVTAELDRIYARQDSSLDGIVAAMAAASLDDEEW